jgi:hypothetical protein
MKQWAYVSRFSVLFHISDRRWRWDEEMHHNMCRISGSPGWRQFAEKKTPDSDRQVVEDF